MSVATRQTSDALDEAYERMAHAGFELPNGFVNHGAMACEALSALGFQDEVVEWARGFSRVAGIGVTATPERSFEWAEALGDYGKLPEWIGYFESSIAQDGWPDVVETWVPRLMPALATVLFHGAIRSAHAVRAISEADTQARRSELARALAYWAARFRSGDEPRSIVEVEDVQSAIVESAASAARFYIRSPSIYFLHGVTGAMAVELLAPHLRQADAMRGLAQLRAEHHVVYENASPATDLEPRGVSESDLATSAEVSRDPHQVKLVEACIRASRLSSDPVFAMAAETVTRGDAAGR